MSFIRSKEKPPVFQACVDKFGISWNGGVIFTYGDTIHCKFRVGPQKIAHEKVHIKQQFAYGVEAWWDRYLADEQFRLEQELEAYKAEISWVYTKCRYIGLRARIFDAIVADLSSFMYGKIVTPEEARKLLNL